MKKVLSVLAVSAFVFAGSSCLAAGGPAGYPMYVKVLGKYAMPSDPEVMGLELESDNGYGLGAAVGLRFDQFRVEAEFATQKSDIDAITLSGWNGSGVGIGSGDTRIDTYMINGYYEFPIGQGFGIYVTGGLGMGTTTISIYNVDDDDTGFAWKGGAGVSYTLNPNMAMDFGWEYVGLDDPSIDDVEVTDVYSNNIVAAFRFMF
jgi:opacity protein-like surface antigen